MRHVAEVTDADGGVPYLVHVQPMRLDGELIEAERAPNFGEHNEYVFRKLLGLDEDEYVQLMVDEVIY